ncbi:alpha/beta fold hydrolase [Flavobacteriaceae bacterium Ap0902]|nr:alpha/beta fold hydrolase [Flavobacteriaceae bacterium Ap0902]
MKTIYTYLLLSLGLALYGQEITGKWHGSLNIQGTTLRLAFNIEKAGNGYKSTMDSPDQSAYDIPVTSTIFKHPHLTIEVKNLGITYQGTLNGNDSIQGEFNQGGHKFLLNLSRKEIKKTVLKRPQEPNPPYPYETEEVDFENNDANIKLAGTLSLPHEGKSFPAVILISGSGPQNRDEEILGHKPFLVLADHLTKHGIAVLRYDDRGVGQSTGDFKTATTADFATDVESAIAYLKTRKEINSNQIGLIGHSEGGIIAPMVANASNDVAFIILLAGTGIRGDQVLIRQQELIAKAQGIPDAKIKKTLTQNRRIFDFVVNLEDTSNLEQKLSIEITKMLDENPDLETPKGISQEDFVAMQVKQITSPWMGYFLKYDPTTALEKVNVPILALNGAKDLQVPPKENLHAIASALTKGGNKDFTIKELPGLNHLFQESETGAVSEYSQIEQTFSPRALKEITHWILSKVN